MGGVTGIGYAKLEGTTSSGGSTYNMFPISDATVICEETGIVKAIGYYISFTITSGWLLLNFNYINTDFIIEIVTPNYTYYFTNSSIGDSYATDNLKSVFLPVTDGTLSLARYGIPAAEYDFSNSTREYCTYVTIYHYPCIGYS